MQVVTWNKIKNGLKLLNRSQFGNQIFSYDYKLSILKHRVDAKTNGGAQTVLRKITAAHCVRIKLGAVMTLFWSMEQEESKLIGLEVLMRALALVLALRAHQLTSYSYVQFLLHGDLSPRSYALSTVSGDRLRSLSAAKYASTVLVCLSTFVLLQ